MRHNKFSEHGQALVVIALAAIVLFGFMALAIDGSAKLSDRRHAQNAADTAAIAAALTRVNDLANNVSDISPTTLAPTTCPPPTGVLPSPLCADLTLDGSDRAISNGYGDDSLKSTVVINSPPTSGYYKDNTDYVQVIITSHVTTYFMHLLGIAQSDNIVQAVAYAKPGKDLADGAMVISYDPHPNCSSGQGTNNGTVSVTGNAAVTLNGGGIFVNSQETCGFGIPNCAQLTISGGAGVDSAATFDNINQDGCNAPYVPVPEHINQEPVVIPDDVYYPPEPPECGTAPWADPLGPDPSYADHADAYLIHPGSYTDFPQQSLFPNNKHIYMASGVYCIDPPHDHDLSWNTQNFESLNGSTDPSKNHFHIYNPDGVTLYIKPSGGFSIDVASPIFLDATTTSSSDYQGYLIILAGTPTDHPSCTINGGSYLDMNGMIFAPYCKFIINGKAGETAQINAQLLGWDLTVNGSNAINFNYDPSNQVHIKRKIGLMK